MPPPVGEGQDELEHYKVQVRIMADLINVSVESCLCASMPSSLIDVERGIVC